MKLTKTKKESILKKYGKEGLSVAESIAAYQPGEIKESSLGEGIDTSSYWKKFK